MPPKQAPPSAPKQPRKDGDGDDLTTILDGNQRADLTLLLASVTESMRKLILDNFNATAGLKTREAHTDMTDEEKIMNASIDPGSADVASYDKERKLKEQFEKELGTAKVKGLRADALRAYDEWREDVIQRVGQVVNSPDKAKEQVKTQAKAEMALPQAPNQKSAGSMSSPLGGVVKFRDLYTPTKTPLTRLSMRQRGLVLHSIFLLLLSLEHYNARSRTLLLNLTSSLKLPLKTFEEDETKVANGLLEQAKELSADSETKKKVEANRDNRKWKVGIATVAGAAIIGVTGGLAAPLVAAGVGSVMGGLGLGATAAAGYLGSVAGSTVIVGSLFGAYGGRMTGQMMDNYSKEVDDFAFIPVHSATMTSEDEDKGAAQASAHDHKLRLTICISGWLTSQDDVVKPWRVIGTGAEVFALRWELEALLNLGNAISSMVTSAAWGYAQKEIIAHSIFAELASALWPIGLMKVARVIDNPFSIAKDRADKAGEVLADALVNKAQGERPVTLIGYSLGARMIYSCLLSLARRKAFGLVESAVLIGAATPSDTADWRIMRTVVSGRLINVYSQNDYVLGFMYRTSSVQYGVAGLQQVEGLPGVENFDVSEDVSGHLKYKFLIGSILKKIGFEDIDMKAVEEEQEALRKMEEEEKQQSLQSQRKRLLRRQSKQGKEDESAEAEAEAQDLQKEIEAKTQKSLMTRAVEWWYLGRQPSAKDAEKAVGDAAGTASKVANNPSEAPNVASNEASQTATDAQRSTQSYTKLAASYLPSRGKQNTPVDANKGLPDAEKKIPSISDAGKKASSTGDAGKIASKATQSAQSYTQRAAGYLPNFRGQSKPAVPADATKQVQSPGKGVVSPKNTPVKSPTKGVTSPNVTPVKSPNASAVSPGTAKSPVSKATGYFPSMPLRGKPSTPDASKAVTSPGKEAPSPGSVKRPASNAQQQANSYTQRAAGYLPNIGSIAGRGKPSTLSTPNTKNATSPAVKNGTPTTPNTKASDAAAKTASSAQGYTQRAAGYLPSMARFGRSPSQAVNKQAPSPASKATDGAAETAVDEKRPSLPGGGANRKPSAPKLPRTPSGVKRKASTPGGLEKQGSTPKVPQTPGGMEKKASTPKVPQTPGGLDKVSTPKVPQTPGGSEKKASAPKVPQTPGNLDKKSSTPKVPQTPGRQASGAPVKSPGPKA